jgi:hypothetical protein
MTAPEYDTEGLLTGQPSDDEVAEAVAEMPISTSPATDDDVPNVEPYDPDTDAAPPAQGWDTEVIDR